MRKNKYSIGNVLIIVFAIIGIVIMGYLISLNYSETTGAFCNLGEGLSCDIVNQSIYSEILGIPVSILGLLYFVAILGLVLWKRERTPYNWIVLLSVISLGPALYLTGIEIFVLKNICVYCETSKILIIAIAATAFVLAGRYRPTIIHIIIATALAILFGWSSYMIHASIVPAGKYTNFTQCIYEKGMRMYGSLGCSFCAKQNALFGDAKKYIREIECDPRYPNPQTDLCIEKNIARTPTWILEDENGNEIKRFDPGVLSLETLAQETGCALPI